MVAPLRASVIIDCLRFIVLLFSKTNLPAGSVAFLKKNVNKALKESGYTGSVGE
jgi:hypothetical protein